MANSSIYAVFERMWQHILVKCNNYASIEVLDNHIEDTNNPHGITAEQIGALSNEALDSHTFDTNNPHYVTAEQIGAMPITGGIMEDTIAVRGIVLTEGIDYGSGDPGSGVLGQLYFKKVT